MPIWMATVKEEDNHQFGQGCGKDALYSHTAGGNIKGEATILKRYFMYMNVCVCACVRASCMYMCRVSGGNQRAADRWNWGYRQL